MKKVISFIFALSISCQCLFADLDKVNFSGDIRTKWKQTHSKEDTLDQFLCEANVIADYNEENTWMKAKVKLSNDFTNGNLSASFEKAYIGYSFHDTLSLEVGRNKMEDIFDSKTQFKSFFNGVCLSYIHNLENIGSFLVHGGPFLIDGSYNRCAYIAEVGMSNIMDTPIAVKYSFTAWPYDYISQATIKYNLDKIIPYVAFLHNHDTKRNGAYVGVTLGKILKARDAYLDLNYQYAQSNCIPAFDFNGIGTGINTKAVYAVTDSLHAQAKFSIATEKERAIELCLIYNW